MIKLILNLIEGRKRERLRQQLLIGSSFTQYYNTYWKQYEKPGFYKAHSYYEVQSHPKSPWQHLFKFLAAQCRGHSNILDVGCGPYELIAVSNTENTLGVDASKAALLALKKFGFKGQTIQADALHLPLRSHTFDCAISNQMIEHMLAKSQLKDLKTELERLSNKIVFVTPNSVYGRKINDPTHFFFFTTRSLKKLFPKYRIYGFGTLSNLTLLYYFQYNNPRLIKIPLMGRIISTFFKALDNSWLLKNINDRLWRGEHLIAIRNTF